MKKRKARRFQEGAYLDFEREPLRDSSGEIVRDSSGEPVMSAGSGRKPAPMTRSMPVEKRAPEAAPGAQSVPMAAPGAAPTIVRPVPRSNIESKPIAPVTAPGARSVPVPETAAASAEGRAPMLEEPARGRAEGIRSENEPLEQVARMGPLGAEDSGTGQLAGIKANVRAPTKQPVVTQEQMRKAGFNNLRDYLNAQRGLTRKQEPAKPAAPVKAAPQKAEPPKMDRQAELDRLMKYDKPLETVNPEMNLLGGPVLRGLKAAGAGLASRLTPTQAVRRGERTLAPERGGGRDPGARRPTQDELDEIRMGSDFMKKGGQVKAKKQSSTVSSASKRADGIAMRGKTRGKYL